MARYNALLAEAKNLRDFAYSDFCSDSIRKIYLRIATELEFEAENLV